MSAIGTLTDNFAAMGLGVPRSYATTVQSAKSAQ